jgi:predicted nucleic acid-binding protein
LERKQSSRLDSLYQRLLKDRLPVLALDSLVARCFSVIKADCRRRGFAASDFDFLIAATAKVNGLILATLNQRHFEGIQGLALEDWSRT